MPQTIKVYLNTANNPPVTVSNTRLGVPGGGTTTSVQWVMGTNQLGSISSISWGSNGDPFSPAPNNGNNWTGSDTNNIPAGGTSASYSYDIKVTYNGEEYSSDPEIVNEPGGGPIPPRVKRNRIHHHAGSKHDGS